jgi:flagellar basal-body rod modification protein FlgD
LVDGQPIQGVINLPTGAEGVKIQVANNRGQVVATQILGSQPIGDLPLVWDGTDDSGNALPNGNYSFKATVLSQGKTSSPSVSILSKVTGINQSPDKTIQLEVLGGKSVNLTDVLRIGA